MQYWTSQPIKYVTTNIPWSKFIAEDLPSNSKYYSTELHVHCPDESNISPIPVAGGTISTDRVTLSTDSVVQPPFIQ